jgi:uncharacterized membrane protein YesL
MTSGHWSIRIHAACSAIAWWCVLNALWIAFTTLGGILLGIGPATVTACILTRRRMRGEAVHALRDFAATWRRELLRGTVVVLPVVVVATILLFNYAFFAALGPQATAPRLVTLVALVLTVGVSAYVGPMYAYYDLPLRSYVIRATRFALARPASTVVLLLVFATLGYATAAVPVLLVTVSIGAWLHASSWLCVRFFDENEERLVEATPPGPARRERILPTEPLRIR